MALVFDEYDAGRPDVMFVIQRILEVEGKLTLLDQNKVITPHSHFRLFATTNTVGLGDTTGLYHGTQQINQGQMDRWSIVSTLNYLEHEAESNIVLGKVPSYQASEDGERVIGNMVSVADLTRKAFVNGDVSTVMSPRTVLTWAQNAEIFGDVGFAFRVTFLNKCDELERAIVAEYYQRCMGEDLGDATAGITLKSALSNAMSDAENPLDPFKRATTATIRAIAGDDELDVTFGAGPPVVRGGTCVCCYRRWRPISEIDAVRGVGEFALRFRHHDARLHARYSPDGGPAQEMFEWIESARIASIGAMRMQGVAQNLDAHLEVQCKQAAFDTITAETDAPLSVAVGLLVRQQLTGRELPPSAEHVVQYWREHVMENAGEHIEALREHVGDQDAFASLCRNIIADLGLPIDLTDPNEGESNPEDMDTMDQSEDAESDFSPEDVVLDDSAGEENRRRRHHGGDGCSRRHGEAGSESDPDEAPLPMPDDAGRIPVDNNYKAYSERFDEIIRAEELCDPDELIRLRQLLDQQLVSLQHATSKLAQPAAAPFDGQAESHWEFDLEEGILDAARLTQVVVDPMNPLAYKQEKETKFQTPWLLCSSTVRVPCGVAPSRSQPCAPILWAVPRALLGTRGDPRLHDPGLAGRRIARGMDQRQQAVQSRSTERSAAYHLQVG